MMAVNKLSHSGYLEYQGTAGKYYRGYICLYAGDSNAQGDNRIFYTNTKLCT